MGKKAQTVAFVTCVKSGVAKQDLGIQCSPPLDTTSKIYTFNIRGDYD